MTRSEDKEANMMRHFTFGLIGFTALAIAACGGDSDGRTGPSGPHDGGATGGIMGAGGGSSGAGGLTSSGGVGTGGATASGGAGGAGPIACGTQTCSPSQACVTPCCGGAPGFQCTPAPPYCIDIPQSCQGQALTQCLPLSSCLSPRVTGRAILCTCA